MNSLVIKVCVVFIMVFGVQNVVAAPRYRVKRVSDTHLADLETRIALSNHVKGVAFTMPVGAGRIDPLRIGRKRRSQTKLLDVLFNQSEEDRGDPSEMDYESFLQRLQNFETQ